MNLPDKEHVARTPRPSEAESQAGPLSRLYRGYTAVPFYARWIFYSVIIVVVLCYKYFTPGMGGLNKSSDFPPGQGNAETGKSAGNAPFTGKRLDAKPADVKGRKANPANLRLVLALDKGAECLFESLALPIPCEGIPASATSPAAYLKERLEKLNRPDPNAFRYLFALSLMPIDPSTREALTENKIVHDTLMLDEDTLETYMGKMVMVCKVCMDASGKPEDAQKPILQEINRSLLLTDGVRRILQPFPDSKKIALVAEITSRETPTIRLEKPSLILALVLKAVKLDAVLADDPERFMTAEEALKKGVEGFLLLNEGTLMVRELPPAFAEGRKIMRISRNDLEYPGVGTGRLIYQLANLFYPDKVNEALINRLRQFNGWE